MRRDRYDWITLWIAGLGVLGVAASTGIAAWQAYLTRQQLDAITDQQRAWLSVEPTLVSDIGVNDVGQIYFELEAITHNTGSLPAQWVRTLGKVYLVGGAPADGGEGTSPLHLCGELVENERGHYYGPTVFPGGERAIVPHIIWPTRDEAIRGMQGRERGDYVLVLCSYYYTGRSTEPRLTGGIYSIARRWEPGEPLDLDIGRTLMEDAEIRDLGIGGWSE